MTLTAKVGNFLTGTGAVDSTVVVSDVGFQPKALLCWWSGRTESTDSAGRASHRRGIGAAASTTSRHVATTMSQDTPTAMVAKRAQDDAVVVAVFDSAGAIDGSLDLSSFDTGGFTLVVRNQFATSYRIHYLALGGTDITNAACFSQSMGAATGDEDLTSLSFQPDCLIFLSATGTLDLSVAADSRLLIGAACADGQAAWEGGSDDAAANANTATYCGDDQCFVFHSSTLATLDTRATFVQFLSNGFRLNFAESPGSTRVVSGIAIKGGKYAIRGTLTQTNTTTDIVISGLTFQPVAGLVLSHCKAELTGDADSDDDVWSMGGFTSTSERGVHAIADDDAAGTAVVSAGVEFDEVYLNLTPASGAVQGLMDVKSVDSGGVTFIMDDADPAQSFFWTLLIGSSAGTEYTRSVDGSQPAATGALARVATMPRSVVGAQPAASAALARVLESVRALTGAQPAATGDLSRLVQYGRALTGSQPAATAQLGRMAEYVRVVAGLQPAASGVLEAGRIFLRDLAGAQPQATATLTRTLEAVRALSGAQPQATATLTRAAQYGRELAGSQPAGLAILARTAEYVRSLAGVQPSGSAAMDRAAETGRSLAGVQPAATGVIARVLESLRTLAGVQPAASATLAGAVAVQRSLEGVQPAATGELTRVVEYVRSVAGSQPAGSGLLSRAMAFGRALAGSQPAATAELTRNVAVSRSLDGAQPAATAQLGRSAEYMRAVDGLQPAATGVVARIVEYVRVLLGAQPSASATLAGALNEIETGTIEAALTLEGSLTGTLVKDDAGSLLLALQTEGTLTTEAE